MDWYEMLHLTHLDPWILHTPAVWPYFQQFLHYSTLGFMFALWIVVMKLLILNLLLMRLLALVLLCTSHILIHTMDMSDLGETLITFGIKIVDDGLNFYFYFYFLFYFSLLFFSFSIFRTTWVRGYQSQLDGVITRLIMGYKRRK